MNSTYRERIRDMVFNCTRGDRDGDIEAEEIIALIQEVAKSAKPDKRSLPKGDLTSVGLQVRFKAQGYNKAIDQYEQNIKELLGGSDV